MSLLAHKNIYKTLYFPQQGHWLHLDIKMPRCQGTETTLAGFLLSLFNCLSYVTNRLISLVAWPSLSVDIPPDYLQNSNCGYSGCKMSYGFWQGDEDEKWKNISSFVC